MNYDYFKIEVYIPKNYLDIVIEVFRTCDIGHIGNYDCCLSYYLVNSQWRCLEGTKPFIGEVNEISTEEEIKIENKCKKKQIEKIIKKIKSIHPYEEPVINIIPIYKTSI